MILSIVLALVIFFYGIPLVLWMFREVPITSTIIVVFVTFIILLVLTL